MIVGGGIVGLAAARALLMRRPGSRVVVCEKGDDIATAQTGHNSGVIHAGLYYAPGSLKARLCRAGEAATKRFCERHGIAHRTPGKLVVATDDAEAARLGALAERATANGIAVRPIGRDQLRELEPAVTGLRALLSPTTGIGDYRAVARALAADIVAAGGRVLVRARLRGIDERPGSVRITADIGELEARTLTACAGLQADRVARLGGLDVDFRIVPFRGEYYQLPAHRGDLVHHLVYPVPDPALPFLGVHLTPMVDGRVTVGPNAVLGFAREGYPKGSLDVRDTLSLATFPGLWRFAPGHLRTGAAEWRDSLSRRGYLARVRKYCPGLGLADLLPYPAGIRAQALGRDGRQVDDFLFRETARQLHVCNAPSPAATSALPIGDLVAEKVLARLA